MNGYKIIKQISHGPSTDVYKVYDKRTINIMALRYLDLIKTMTKP